MNEQCCGSRGITAMEPLVIADRFCDPRSPLPPPTFQVRHIPAPTAIKIDNRDIMVDEDRDRLHLANTLARRGHIDSQFWSLPLPD